ncbi:MAG: RNA polymerase sigma factor [Longimicrobiales bacterium]
MLVPTREATDHELIEQVTQTGDERAFRELYRRHTPRLYALVLRMLASETDTDDVVQETWLRAIRAASRFRWEASFSSWLTAIALNCARGLRRRERRWPTTELADDAPARGAWPATDARLDIERVLERVPPGYRAVLTLYELEGRPHEEIAQRLGIAIGTSKSQLHHARRFLRTLLDPRNTPAGATA